MADPAVRVQGLREFRRDLRRLQPEVAKGLTKELKAAGDKVAKAAQSDPRTPRRTGEYARSIRPYVTARGVSVGSRLPQAGVVHWGGTIRPRGVPIKFEPHPTVLEAAERQVGTLVDDIGDAVESAARRTGWHR